MKRLALILIIAFAGCYTPKVATKQVYKAYAKQPAVTADFCNTIYPIVSNTQYIRGKDSIITKWQTVDCDSVIKYDTVKGADHIVNVPCDCPSPRVDTVVKTVESTAKLAAKDIELNAANDTIAQKEKSLKTAHNINAVIGALLVLSIIGNVALLKIKI